jgi:cell division protein FtsB
MPKGAQPDSGVLTSLVIGTCLLFFLLLVFAWGNSLYSHSTQIRQIEQFQQENERLAAENREFQASLRYLRSPQYSDKWAKEVKGLAQPGERVLLVEFLDAEKSMFRTDDQDLIEREILLSRPNREQWQIFFLGED